MRRRRGFGAVSAGVGLVAIAVLWAAPAQAASGVWERAWGVNVNGASSGALEICTTAVSCTTGVVSGVGGGLSSPRGVATDAAGNVYVADFNQNRVQKFDASGNFVFAIGRNVVSGGLPGPEICTVAANCLPGDDGFNAGEFTEPAGIAVDPSGRIYVADRALDHVQRLDPAGNWEATLVGSGGGFSAPQGVATDAAGNVYVADSGWDRIQKFNSSLSFDRMWGWEVRDDGDTDPTGFDVCTAAQATSCRPGQASGGAGGGLENPLGVTVDGAGNVYVADTDHHRIQRYDSSGNFVLTWGKNVLSSGGLGFHEICSQGQVCQSGSSATEFGGELDEPSAVAADGAGNVYAADSDNARLQKFGSGGAFVSAWGRDVINGGSAGYEVCTDAASCKIGLQGVAGGEFNIPAGAAATAAGALYVSDLLLQRIQKFAADPPPPAAAPATAGPTGQRAAALKKCKKKKSKKKRKKCRKKARQLPI